MIVSRLIDTDPITTITLLLSYPAYFSIRLLLAGVKTIDTNHETVNRDAVNVLTNLNVAKDDDLVIITKGDLAGIEGGTNAIKVVKVGHLVEV